MREAYKNLGKVAKLDNENNKVGILMNLILKMLFILLAIASFSTLFSSVYWFFDLFNHFRVQAVIASIILWIISFILYKRNLIFPTVVLVGNIILFTIPLLKTSGTVSGIKQDSTDKLSIVFANVYKFNANYSDAENLLIKENPDIIALAEVTPSLIENFRTLKTLYPHTLELPRSNSYGLAVYSKRPFKAQVMNVGLFEIPLARFDFKGFKLVVVHSAAPVSELGLQENKAYLKTIARITSSSQGPLIVAGDFNCTLWGDALKPAIQGGLKRTNRMGISFTWPVYFPLFAMQIDHIFVRDVAVFDSNTLGNIGSDHYPIQATVGVPNSF